MTLVSENHISLLSPVSNNTTSHSDKLGFYKVGDKKFYNKTLALLENFRTKEDVHWIFNTKVYGSIDWTIPVETPLLELYKNRAQQLRDQYDYLVLYFSGGADSANILHAFVENNIFLDEIVMHLPKPVTSFNDTDLSNGNYYSEIKYSAIPILERYKNKINPATKILYQDFARAGLELLEKDNWFELVSICTNITISGICRQMEQIADSYYLDLYSKGKTVARILGIDKPLVYYDGEYYYSFFIDSNTYHYMTPVGITENYQTEFFYWTPDMPEIIVKQAQLIKLNCESNPYARFMASQIQDRHIAEFRDVLHPVIYPDITIGFQTEKAPSAIVRAMDRWFWKTASQKVKNNYLSTIKYLQKNTDPKYMIKNSIGNGFAGYHGEFYKL